ncbi:PilW family protein [Variovorax sp. RHLX14]|uniref:PilW family protein n=1 Tax=Variovorax sp. RHLX14 TaxID=1259731 RepID=UPI003F457A3E
MNHPLPPERRVALLRIRNSRGFTLIELMVALALTLLVVIVATAALQVARRGHVTTDAASQLLDNARFAADAVRKLAGQVGYLDADIAAETDSGGFVAAGTTAAEPFVQGTDDAIYPSAAKGINGSDILVLRSQASAIVPGSTKSDGTMLDCMGAHIEQVPSDRSDASVSMLFLRVGSDGEPSLMCATGTTKSGATTMEPTIQPIVQGVETFQVLYGVDGVSPNTRAVGTGDSVADRYLRASQVTVPGDVEGTRLNWQRVRSLRIGLVLRGAPNLAQDRTIRTTLFPLGEAMSAADDAGARFVPAKDGRLRQVLTFVVNLHNRQQL